MAYYGHDEHGFQARLTRSLWIYAQYQLAGLALSWLSIVSMLAADRNMLTREPNLALIYLFALAVPLGACGVVKAIRRFAVARPQIQNATLQPR